MITKEQLLAEEQRLLPLYEQNSIYQLLFWNTWTQTVRDALPNFRGELMYLAQLVGTANEQSYEKTVQYITNVAEYKELLGDNDTYGNIQVETSAGKVSRDLLDSICEIQFLERQGLLADGYDGKETIDCDLSVLDIGAGYGRFALRLTTLYPGVTVICTDAVPLSTAICTEYVMENNDDNKKKIAVMPLHTIEYINKGTIELAVNIHSWSECSIAGVHAWLNFLDRKEVKQLFLVMHDYRMATYDNHSIIQACKEHGFEVVVSESKYERATPNERQQLLYDAPYVLLRKQ